MGGPAKRVHILFQKDNAKHYSLADYNFVKENFNRVRNYREFTENSIVEIIEHTSDKLPDINSIKKGDAILLDGDGRFVDESCYNFAIQCINQDIPVYFIRSNSLDTDCRAIHNIWKSAEIAVVTNDGQKNYGVPTKYFMEIPRAEDFICFKIHNKFFALFPAMVPIN